MIFNRRDLLKSMLPVALTPTLTINGKPAAAASAVHAGRYVLFADAQVVDGETLADQRSNLADDIVIEIVLLKLHHGQTIDDAVRLYELADPRH